MHHEKLKSFLPVNILRNPSHPAEVVKIWKSSSTKIYLFSRFVQGIFKGLGFVHLRDHRRLIQHLMGFVQLGDFRRLRQQHTQETAVKAANAIVGLAIAISCSGVFQDSMLGSSKLSREAWLGLSPAQLDIHI